MKTEKIQKAIKRHLKNVLNEKQVKLAKVFTEGSKDSDN